MYPLITEGVTSGHDTGQICSLIMYFQTQSIPSPVLMVIFPPAHSTACLSQNLKPLTKIIQMKAFLKTLNLETK